MAAPLIPILAGALRALVGRAAAAAFGRAAASVAPKIGARAIAAHATRQGATAAAAETVAGRATAAVARNAASKAARAPGIGASFSGYARQAQHHVGQFFSNIQRGWNGEPLQWQRYTAPTAPQTPSSPAASSPPSGATTRAQYANSETSDSNEKLLRPFKESAESSRPGASFGDVVKGYARQAQHHAGQFFSNVRRGWNGQPLQWQSYTPPSAPPASSPPTSAPAAGGAAGKFADLAAGYARQAASWVQTKASQTTVGEMYRAVQDRLNYKPADPGAPPKYQPNVIPVYPNLTEDRLAQLSGQSADAFAQANADAGAQQKRVEEEQRLLDVTKRLNGAFGKIIGWAGKLQFAPLLFGAGVTNAVNPYIDAQVNAYGRYNAAFAFMGKQREVTDIQLSQRTAAATAGSARFVNDANLEGQRILSEIYRDLKPLMNTAVGSAQHVANIALRVSEYMPLLATLRQLGRALEVWFGKQKEIDPRTVAQIVMDEALKAQQLNAHEKRPLKGVF